MVCGSDLSQEEADRPTSASKVADRRVKVVTGGLAPIEAEVAGAREQLAAAEQHYDGCLREVRRLNDSVIARSARMDELIKQLPPGEAQLHRARQGLALLRGRLDELRADLVRQRHEFEAFVADEQRGMAVSSERIPAAFADYAKEFLFEDSELTWSPQRAQVGQTGNAVVYPAFELEMTGASFPTPIRRSGPDEVSESQREFIDLAFRMALIDVIGADRVGSIVIDAPETSLDALFVSRAAGVLARFAEPARGNRLIITSNLIEGQLIPTLLRLASTPDDRSKRLVNLFKLAAPTAAVRAFGDRYDSILQAMLAQVDSGGEALNSAEPVQ